MKKSIPILLTLGKKMYTFPSYKHSHSVRCVLVLVGPAWQVSHSGKYGLLTGEISKFRDRPGGNEKFKRLIKLLLLWKAGIPLSSKAYRRPLGVSE